MITTLLLFQKIALVGGMLHSMVPGAKPAPGTILIDHGLIEAIGKDVAIPADAKRVPIEGLHVLPGLIDAMVNFDADHDQLYLSCGVTLVRELGADLTQMLAERDSNARDRNPGPSLFIAGAILDGVPPATHSAAVISTPAEAVDWGSRLLHPPAGEGVDYLSYYPGLTKECWEALVALAHREAPPRQVWGMRPKGAALDDVLRAGQDGIFYLDALLPAEKHWADMSDEDIAALAKKVGQSKIAVTPVLGLYASRLVPPPKSPPDLKYLGPIQVSQWLADREGRAQIFIDKPELAQQNLTELKQRFALVKALHENGVALVPGSGCGMAPWLLPGEALLNELSLWVGQAGMGNSEVLHLATSASAARIGAQRFHGSLEVGKLASFVITRADPEQDLKQLYRPDYVMIRGRLLAAAELEELRGRLAIRQQYLQAQAFRPLKLVPPRKPKAPGELLPAPEPGEIELPEAPPGELQLSGLVETRYQNQRLSGESFMVSRMSDGALVYAARSLTFGAASTADSECQLTEKIQDGRLVEFELISTSGPRVVSLKGTLAGGTLNVERRYNGVYQDMPRVRERVAFLEAGSVLTDLILGQSVQTGPFQALFLQDFDLAISDKWDLRVDPASSEHLLRGPQGDRVVDFAADGAPQKSTRESGRANLVRTLLFDQPVKSGLPLPKKKNPDPPKAAPPAVAPPKK